MYQWSQLYTRMPPLVLKCIIKKTDIQIQVSQQQQSWTLFLLKSWMKIKYVIIIKPTGR